MAPRSLVFSLLSSIFLAITSSFFLINSSSDVLCSLFFYFFIFVFSFALKIFLPYQQQQVAIDEFVAVDFSSFGFCFLSFYILNVIKNSFFKFINLHQYFRIAFSIDILKYLIVSHNTFSHLFKVFFVLFNIIPDDLNDLTIFSIQIQKFFLSHIYL